jgi:flagellar protein FliS
MNPQAAQNYLRTKVLTATQEQLQLMLFDGAIRFGEQARIALQNKNYEQSFRLLNHTQKIINELRISLKHDIAPELCGNLTSLYNFAHRRLVEANIEHRVELVDEALRVLKFQRQTWVMLMEKLSKEKAGLVANKMDIPGPNPRMEASISVQG